MQHNTDNVRIISSAPMVSPNTLIDKLPLSEKAASVVVSSRNAIKNILYGNDNRLMVLVGPCSIHDTKCKTCNNYLCDWVKGFGAEKDKPKLASKYP